MKVKVSDKQKEILLAMRGGSEIAKFETFAGGAMLTKTQGLVNINLNTWASLLDKKLICIVKRSFPTSRYVLTELGKTIEL